MKAPSLPTDQDVLHLEGTTNAHGQPVTPRDVVERFVRTHWSYARKARKYDGAAGTFQVVGGTGRVYHVGRYASPNGGELFAVTTEKWKDPKENS
jgi:hypothetical protein